MIQVVDVSVAARWFAPDGDASDAAAETVLRQIVAQPKGFVVPELFMHELLAVLCRRLRQASDVAHALDRVARLGLRRVALDQKLIRRAARIAFEYRLTGYDACYAALAVELDGKWLTFDVTAGRRLSALDVCRIPGEH